MGPGPAARGTSRRLTAYQRTAALLGDDFDPRRVTDDIEGWVVELRRSRIYDDDWEGYLGHQRLDCCMEPDPVRAPEWRDGVLSVRSATEGGFYGCRGQRELRAHPRGDGRFEVELCGRRMKMVRSADYGERHQQWSRATAARIMNDPVLATKLDCRAVALDCDLRQIAAACPLPLARTLVFAPGRAPFVLPPRSLGPFTGVSRLDFVMEEDDPPPVWCLSTSSESP